MRHFIQTKRAAVLLAAVILLGLGGTFLLRKPAYQPVSATRNAIEMGTAVSVTLYADKGMKTEEKVRESLREKAAGLLQQIDTLDREILSWRSEISEVHAFNQTRQTEPVSVSGELAQAVETSLRISDQTQGALDITLRPVIDLWGIENYDGTVPYLPPTDEALADATAEVGYENLSVSSGKLRKSIPELSLDLGAVGKGFALDIILNSLRADPSIRGAVFAAGGSILVYGDKGAPWQIGIRDPEGSENDYLGILSIESAQGNSAFVSTSGGYEKYVESDGRIYEHIIDGRILRPAESDLYSVTIVTKDSGLVSDGLSTACYILGMEGSQELLKTFNAEAIFITRNKEIFLTAGLKDQLALTNRSYKLAGAE